MNELVRSLWLARHFAGGEYWDHEVEDIGPGWERICGMIAGGHCCVLSPRHDNECMFTLMPVQRFKSISGYWYAWFPHD